MTLPSRPTRARGLKPDIDNPEPTCAQVAPHAGAWIETPFSRAAAAFFSSRPTRARGLKHTSSPFTTPFRRSRPTRARGLKLAPVSTHTSSSSVAPHAGAWIETSQVTASPSKLSVAPHAGAWIETKEELQAGDAITMSRPTRARGLKRMKLQEYSDKLVVAPHAGAWIETDKTYYDCEIKRGRAPRGRVD